MINKRIIKEDFASAKLTNIVNQIKQQYQVECSKKIFNFVSDILTEMNWMINREINIGDQTLEVQSFFKWLDKTNLLYRNHNSEFLDYTTYLHTIEDVKQLDQFIVGGDFLNKFAFEYYSKDSKTEKLTDEDKKQIQEILNKLYNNIQQRYDYKNFTDFGFKSDRNVKINNTYKAIQQEFSKYGLDKISDEDVIFVDKTQFKRKARSEYGMCIALKNNIPLYVCMFSDNGAIDFITDLSGEYRGRSIADRTIRWTEVENACDTIMVFNDLGRYSNLMKERHPYKLYSNYYDPSYRSGKHLTDAARRNQIDSDKIKIRDKIIYDRKEKCKLSKDNDQYVQKISELSSLLDQLRFKTTELFNDIKDYDPFDEMDSELSTKQLLISKCVELYNRIKQVKNKYPNDKLFKGTWESKSVVDELNKYVSEITTLLNALDLYVSE